MGLDCYVEDAKGEELWYGRKENEIHGWMQRKSGIPAEDFNCKKLLLTEELLEEFISDARDGKLCHTKGFIFGVANDEESVKNNASKLFHAAYPLACDGQKVYYSSWW